MDPVETLFSQNYDFSDILDRYEIIGKVVKKYSHNKLVNKINQLVQQKNEKKLENYKLFTKNYIDEKYDSDVLTELVDHVTLTDCYYEDYDDSDGGMQYFVVHIEDCKIEIKCQKSKNNPYYCFALYKNNMCHASIDRYDNCINDNKWISFMERLIDNISFSDIYFDEFKTDEEYITFLIDLTCSFWFKQPCNNVDDDINNFLLFKN